LERAVAPRASVLIPTLHPGPRFERVLRAIAAQQADFGHELVVVDSGSGPADIATMEAFGARVERISRSEFGQGKTRNLLAELARGELLFFLSQDAEPADDRW